jgi:hypothetical protein
MILNIFWLGKESSPTPPPPAFNTCRETELERPNKLAINRFPHYTWIRFILINGLQVLRFLAFQIEFDYIVPQFPLNSSIQTKTKYFWETKYFCAKCSPVSMRSIIYRILSTRGPI